MSAVPPQVYRHTQAGFHFLRHHDRPHQPTNARDTAPTPRQVSAPPPPPNPVPGSPASEPQEPGTGANQHLGLFPSLRSPRPRVSASPARRGVSSMASCTVGQVRAAGWEGAADAAACRRRPRGVLASHHDNYEGCRLLLGRGPAFLMEYLYRRSARHSRVSASAGRCICVRAFTLLLAPRRRASWRRVPSSSSPPHFGAS